MNKKSWYEHFSENFNPVFTEKDFNAYKEMTIQDMKFYGKYVKQGAKILDVGCGIGSTIVSLSSLGYKTVGIDNDKKVVEAVKENGKRFGKDIEIKHGDIFDMTRIFKHDSFDACISGGVLEHFEIHQIRKLIELQLELAPIVLADMPVMTERTMKHFRFTKENAFANKGPDGIYRNFWSEDEWINRIFTDFDVVDHVVKKIHPSIGNFDELFVVIKRK